MTGSLLYGLERGRSGPTSNLPSTLRKVGLYNPASGAPAAVSGPARPPRRHARPPGGAPSGDEDDDELRRMLIRQMTAAGCRVDGRFLGAVDRIRRRLDDALSGSTVSAAMIDTWEQAAAGYARQYMTVPALRLLCDVLLDLGGDGLERRARAE